MFKTAIEILKHIGEGIKNAALCVVWVLLSPVWLCIFLWCVKFHPEWFDDFD